METADSDSDHDARLYVNTEAFEGDIQAFAMRVQDLLDELVLSEDKPYPDLVDVGISHVEEEGELQGYEACFTVRDDSGDPEDVIQFTQDAAREIAMADS